MEDKELLLEALKAGDEDKVESLACGMFITNSGNCNWTNINAFEKFADCTIFGLEKDSFGWVIGGIRFQGKVFSYG